jgi:hypothetical protein
MALAAGGAALDDWLRAEDTTGRGRPAGAGAAQRGDGDAALERRKVEGDPARRARAASAHRTAVMARARRAIASVAAAPLRSSADTLVEALDTAATLFDAGLFFEAHEVLEPHWRRSSGDEREAIQGLIQIAVGCQHRVAGNARGARSLLEHGAARVRGRRVLGVALDRFADAIMRSDRSIDPGAIGPAVAFPRMPGAPSATGRPGPGRPR